MEIKPNTFPNYFGSLTAEAWIIQGGSNHALDTLLTSDMQNRETQSDG
jgi:hypothetical protein